MLRTMASALFYARFFNAFSTRGFDRRVGALQDDEFDFRGQRWLVTGASGGIGRAAVLKALACGAEVFAVARCQEKLERLASEAAAPDRLHTLVCDLSLLSDTRDLATHPTLHGAPIDALVNNVGVLLNDFQRSAEGLELSLATNLVGHFVLTEALLSADRLGPEAAVVEASSGGMYGAALNLDKLTAASKAHWDGVAAYALQKRAQVELVRAWNARWPTGRRAYVMHPGWVDTAGVQTALPAFRATLRRALRNADQGADTILWLIDQQPAMSSKGGIWLDRHLDDEHAFALTRQSRWTAADLYDRLEDTARGVLA